MQYSISNLLGIDMIAVIFIGRLFKHGEIVSFNCRHSVIQMGITNLHDIKTSDFFQRNLSFLMYFFIVSAVIIIRINYFKLLSSKDLLFQSSCYSLINSISWPFTTRYNKIVFISLYFKYICLGMHIIVALFVPHIVAIEP